MTIEELTKMLHTQMDLLGRVLTIVEDQERRLIALEARFPPHASNLVVTNPSYMVPEGETVQLHDPWVGFTSDCMVLDTWGISENDVDKEDLQ